MPCRPLFADCGQSAHRSKWKLGAWVMSAIIVMAVVVFALSAIAVIPLWSRFRRALMTRHPAVWAEISRRWFVDHAIMSFATSDRLKELNDPALSRAASHLKWVRAILLGSWLAFGVAAFFDSWS